ncbi:MAG: polysaccharide deacetylase family protein, partial [Arcobacteraceae bacterium]|nr:polysaccharide deacetylase family protein [Arcobacteraceae bacterium]
GDDKHPSTNTSLTQLKNDFEYFRKNNYEVVPLSTLVKTIQDGKEVPANWVVLTIDDAYKSFYTNGLEIFKEYGYPFSLFVYVKATDEKYGDFMTWDMLKEVLPYGEVELHSYSHPRLTNLTIEQIKADTQKSYEIFEKKMGYKPRFYAYPYGEYDDNVKKAIKDFGFEAILNQSSGATNKNSDLFDLFRVPLVGKVDIKEKLKYTAFDVEWIEPLEFPKDGILKKVRAKVNKDVDKVKLFITGEKWIEEVDVVDGMVDIDLNIYLKNSRTRIIIGTTYYNIANKILIK